MTTTARNGERVAILLVDDRAEDLLAMKAILDRPEYEIVTAASGQEALLAVLRHAFAVIVLDVAMPALDGFETARLIRQRLNARATPIIFISAVVYDMEHVLRAYIEGAADFLPKPIDPPAFRAKVAIFADLAWQAREIERKESALREAERREREFVEAMYQATFEEAPVGIGQVAIDGRWLRVNRRLADIVGYSPEELSFLSITDVIHPDDRGRLENAIQGILASSGARRRDEYRLLRPDGSRVWIVLTISLLRDQAGAPVHLTIVEDISEQKAIEESLRARALRDLREGVRARDDFLTISAHELKTPLTPIVLMVTGLLACARKATQPVAPEWLAEHLEPVERAVVRLQSLIDNLLQVSCATVGQLPLEHEEIDLSTLTRALVDDHMRPQIEAARCPVSLELEAEVFVRVDRLRIEQALAALVGNAIKYGPGKPIEIATSQDEDTARLSVRDRGIGIPLEDQARIFDRFERLTPPRHHGGFGVGLWVARQSVEAHCGRIHVWSEPGDGSRFTIELPRRPREAAISVGARGAQGEP